MQRPIVVLGPKGMLGQMVVRYFTRQKYKVLPVEARFTPEGKDNFFRNFLNYPEAVVINCIGKIKQKTEDTHELMWANAILPLALANELHSSQLLIHPSTDCVFSGRKGSPYGIEEEPDARDDYGWSKRLGEVALLGRPNTLIPRVSIIGPDWSANPKGLLGWFSSQPNGSELNGYTNHYWNGITTLEWCKEIEQYICDSTSLDQNKATLIQYGTNQYYSKFEMLKLFAEIFEKDVEIKRFATGEAIDRTLKPVVVTRELPQQLRDLVNFS